MLKPRAKESWVTEIPSLKTKKRQPGPDRSRGKLTAVQVDVYLNLEYSKRNNLSRKKMAVGVRDARWASGTRGGRGELKSS